MIWQEFEIAAPALARAGRERLERGRVALLGSLRADGWPRISPVGVTIALGHVLFGVMRSHKLDDLLRDPRCTLHSPVIDASGRDGEFKLVGRAALVEDPLIRDGDYDAWWRSFPPEAGSVFSLDIESASYVGWDVAAGELTAITWSPATGVTESRRRYP